MDQGSLSRGNKNGSADALRDALVRCDRTLGAIGPLLSQLVADSDTTLFHEEVLARVRGMLDSLAERLLRHFLDASGAAQEERVSVASLDLLTRTLADEPALLGHLHALAIEWRLTQRLSERRAIERVLSPLVQKLVGSEDADLAQTAMAFLTAQARFVQAAQRMQVDPSELPADLLHSSLTILRKTIGNHPDTRRAADLAIRHVQETYDEAKTRLGLAAALVSRASLRKQALDPEAAGFALFATALGEASAQTREQTVLATTEGQAVLFAVMLRAAGCDHDRTERVLLSLYPEFSLPEGVDDLDRHRAASLLAGEIGASARI